MIDSMPENLDAPWEPRTFAVGDRVRVRLNGECRMRYTIWDDLSTETVDNDDGHYPQEEGAVGTVVDWSQIYRGYNAVMGHTVAVRFDDPGPYVQITGVEGKVWLTSRSYAAIELEPLEDDRA